MTTHAPPSQPTTNRRPLAVTLQKRITMIFTDKLKEIENRLSPEMDRLLNLALEKQNHIGDLLLLRENGFFQEEIVEYNKDNEYQFNPHVVGLGREGHSEHTHYLFIHKYRTNNIHKQTLKEYLGELKFSPDKQEKINKITELEATSIQLEMLIYLKFWEADLIIKKLYQN